MADSRFLLGPLPSRLGRWAFSLLCLFLCARLVTETLVMSVTPQAQPPSWTAPLTCPATWSLSLKNELLVAPKRVPPSDAALRLLSSWCPGPHLGRCHGLPLAPSPPPSQGNLLGPPSKEATSLLPPRAQALLLCPLGACRGSSLPPLPLAPLAVALLLPGGPSPPLWLCLQSHLLRETFPALISAPSPAL